MKEIELLEKYARQRQKYRKWDFYPKDTDTQRLSREETACWTLLFSFGVQLHSLVGHLFTDRLSPKLAAAGVLAFCGYLVFVLNRTRKLRSLFERTAVQSAGDLIEIMKSASSQASHAAAEAARGAASSAREGRP